MVAKGKVIVGAAILCSAVSGAWFSPSGGLCAEDLANNTADATVVRQSSEPLTNGRPAATPVNAEASSRNFKQLHLDLASARVKAHELDGYTAVLEIQEERDEQLKPADQVRIKIRHEPFSVYMRWNESGQEVLFVDGENDNRLLVKPTSALAALKRVWRLDPESRMAKQGCKYPITTSGIEKLTARVQEYYAAQDNWLEIVQCQQCSDTVSEVPVKRYDVKFRDKVVSPEFSGGRYCFDLRSGLLIAVENFGWSATPEARLMERYIYHAIDSKVELLDADFDQGNPNYEFAVR